MERPSLLSPLNGDEKRLTTVPQRTVSLLCETDAKQASVQLLKRQALGVWHADALSDVENAIGDLHFWPTTWSKDPRSRDYDMQRLGRSKRLDNRERFELFRFVVGNGASPALAVELLAASESLPDTFAITQSVWALLREGTCAILDVFELVETEIVEPARHRGPKKQIPDNISRHGAL